MSSNCVSSVHYVAGGTVQAGDGVYVERAADAELLRLCREGRFTYVLTSRQMGKSSLMVRTAEKLLEEGIRPVIIDLTELGAQTTQEQWFRGVLQKIEEQLELRRRLSDWWSAQAHLSMAHRFSSYLVDVVVPEAACKIVIFVDEIDSTLRLDFTDDFFASIRYLYNGRARDPKLSSLSFVLLGVASPGDLIKDAQRTPFNIGERVELEDFTEEQSAVLHPDRELVREVLRYTGGHPYLTLRVFRSLAEYPLRTDIGERITSLFLGGQAQKDSNLQFVRDMLTLRAPDRNAVLDRYREVLSGRKPVPDKEADPTCVWLRLSGVVRQRAGKLFVSNRIYAYVFNEAWVRRNRIVEWTRRALWGAGAVAAVAVFIAVAMTILRISDLRRRAQEETKKAIESLVISRQKQDELAQKSDEDKRRREEAEKHQHELLVAQREAQRQKSLAEEQAQRAIGAAEEARAAATDAQRQREIANQKRAEADAAKDEATTRLMEARAAADRANRAELEVAAHNLVTQSLLLQSTHPDQIGLAMLLAIESYKKSDNQEYQDDAIKAITSNLFLLPREVAPLSRGVAINSVAFSRGGRVAFGAEDGKVEVFESAQGRLLLQQDSGSPIRAVAFSPDGRFIAIGSDNNTARVLEITSKSEVLRTQQRGPVLSVAFSPDGQVLAVASQDGSTQLLHVLSNRKLMEVSQPSAVLSVAFSPNGQLLATGNKNGVIHLFEISHDKLSRITGRQLVQLDHGSPVNSVAFSPNSGLLAVGCEDKIALIYDGAWREVARFPHDGAVRSVGFGASGRLLVTASNDMTARVFASVSWHELIRVPLQGPLRSVAISPDSEWLATGGEDKTARIFAIGQGHDSSPTVAFNSQGALEDTSKASFESKAFVLEGSPGHESLCRHCPDWLHSLAMSHDGQFLAIGGEDTGVRVFDLKTRRRVAEFARVGPVLSVAFSPDGRWLGIGAKDNVSLVVDVHSKRELMRINHSGPVNSVAFSQDGHLFASAGDDGTAQLFEVSSRKRLAVFNHDAGVLSVAFSPDGHWLATASKDRAPRVFDLVKLREGPPLQVGGMHAHYVAFDPDSRLLAVTANDNTARVFEIVSGKSVGLSAHSGNIHALAFHDPRHIAIAGYSFLDIGLWKPDDIIADACARLPRNLTQQEWQEYEPKHKYEKTCPQLPGPADDLSRAEKVAAR